MAKKFYLHIGPHKTGSSYLQKLLTTNRARLREYGVLYPDILFSLNGHHQIANYFKKGASNRKTREMLETLEKAPEDLLLSSEAFSELDRRSLNRLKRSFPSREFECIVYVRNPSRRLISFWQERIKQGGTENFWSYALPHFLKPLKSEVMNPVLMLEPFKKVFGKERLHLIGYDEAYERGEMMRSFMRVLEREDAVSDEDLTVNPMKDLGEIELLRLLNIVSGGETERGENRKILAKVKKSRGYSRLLSRVHRSMKEVILGDTPADRMIIRALETRYRDRFVAGGVSHDEKRYAIAADMLCDDRDFLDILRKSCDRFVSKEEDA